MKLMSKHRGFTLMELLVVVAIIGILSTVVIAFLSSTREKARDKKREQEAKQIQTTLELYYNEHGTYPVTVWASSNNTTQWTNLSNTLGVTLPVDPLNTGTTDARTAGNYTYSYYSTNYGCTGQWYMLVYRLETNPNPTNLGVKTCLGGTYNYSGTRTVGMNNIVN